MEFTDLYSNSDLIAKFSPNGKYLACAAQFRLVVRDVDTLQIIQLFTCLDTIQYIEWSPDSEFILCALFKRSVIQVWSLECSEWNCRIDEGTAGFEAVCWSPDSRHILSTAQFALRLTVWSLVEKSVAYIKYPKPLRHRGRSHFSAAPSASDGVGAIHAFSPDGRYLALAERRNCRDYISLFDVAQWLLIRHYPPQTEDLDGMCWSPDTHLLAIWDSVFRFSIQFYTLDGHCVATYTPTSSPLSDLPVGSTVSLSGQPTGAAGSSRRTNASAATAPRSATASASAAISLTLGALGVNSGAVQWAPNAQLLAVGSLDRRLRLLSALTCRPVAELDHSRPLAALVRAERSRLANGVGVAVGVEPRARSRKEMGAEQKENATEDEEIEDEKLFSEACPRVFWEIEEKPLSLKDCVEERDAMLCGASGLLIDESNLRNISSHCSARACRRPLEPSRVFLQPSRYDQVSDVREIERRERQLRLEKAVTGAKLPASRAAPKSSRRSETASRSAESRSAGATEASSSRARVEMVGSLLSAKDARDTSASASASAAVAHFTPDLHGVWLAEFGAGGRLLASVDAARPRVLYVWDLAGGNVWCAAAAGDACNQSLRTGAPRLVRGVTLSALLVQLRDVQCARWESGSGERLAVASNSPRFYLWSPRAGARSVHVPHPDKFNVVRVEWAPSLASDALLLQSREQFCLCRVDSTPKELAAARGGSGARPDDVAKVIRFITPGAPHPRALCPPATRNADDDEAGSEERMQADDASERVDGPPPKARVSQLPYAQLAALAGLRIRDDVTASLPH